MWLVVEGCGVVCSIVTYFIVVFVYFGFVRIGIWEEILEGDIRAYIHFIVFQYHCFMIFLSHFKCMTTEPGLLPKEHEVLQFTKLPPALKRMLRSIAKEMKKLEQGIRTAHVSRVKAIKEKEAEEKEKDAKNKEDGKESNAGESK